MPPWWTPVRQPTRPGEVPNPFYGYAQPIDPTLSPRERADEIARRAEERADIALAHRWFRRNFQPQRIEEERAAQEAAKRESIQERARAAGGESRFPSGQGLSSVTTPHGEAIMIYPDQPIQRGMFSPQLTESTVQAMEDGQPEVQPEVQPFEARGEMAPTQPQTPSLYDEQGNWNPQRFLSFYEENPEAISSLSDAGFRTLAQLQRDKEAGRPTTRLNDFFTPAQEPRRTPAQEPRRTPEQEPRRTPEQEPRRTPRRVPRGHPARGPRRNNFFTPAR